jgi:hypothetical protein
MASGVDARADRETQSAALRVALVAAVVYLAFVALFAIARDGPAWFVKFGETSTNTQYGRQILGDDLVVPFDESQDGTAFWVLARDPLLRDTPMLESNLDRPSYRAQRILYPALAAPWKVGGETALLWGLVLTNVAAVAIGTWFTARLAQLLGGRAQVGYIFALVPAVVVALVLDLAEIVALAGLVATVYLVRRDRWVAAILAGTVAVLAKEAAWPVVLAVALGVGSGAIGRRADRWMRSALLAGIPAVAAGLWAVYVRTRLGGEGFGSQEFTAVPFSGYADAWRLAWRPARHWGDLGVAVLSVVVAVLAIVQWWRRRSLELWAALPYALIVPFFSFQVVNRNINMVRGVAPVVLFLLVDWLAIRWRDRRVARPTPAVT